MRSRFIDREGVWEYVHLYLLTFKEILRGLVRSTNLCESFWIQKISLGVLIFLSSTKNQTKTQTDAVCNNMIAAVLLRPKRICQSVHVTQ